MTEKEVLAFWTKWCRAQRISTSVRKYGRELIHDNHVYWASASMARLYDSIKTEFEAHANTH
jgi:hypothetical protein